VIAQYSELDPDVLQELGDLTEPKFETPQVVIQHVTPYPNVIQQIVYPRNMMSCEPQGVRRVRACTIIMAAFERDRIAPELAEMMSMAAEVWTPCSSAKQALQNSGVSAPIEVMPHPHAEDDPFVTTTRFALIGRPLRILNVGKWEPRKGHHLLIGAFLMAFGPRDDVELILKTKDWGTWRDYPCTASDSIRIWSTDERVIRNGWTADNLGSRIKIFPSMLTRGALARMYSWRGIRFAGVRRETDADAAGVLSRSGSSGFRDVERHADRDMACTVPSAIRMGA
jgi:glycosyltransferase involved in cell wall biosynthesis